MGRDFWGLCMMTVCIHKYVYMIRSLATSYLQVQYTSWPCWILSISSIARVLGRFIWAYIDNAWHIDSFLIKCLSLLFMTDETITTDNTSRRTFYIVYMYLLTDTCITCMYLFSRGVPIICEDVWQSLAEKRCRDVVHPAKYLSMILLVERKMNGCGDSKGKKSGETLKSEWLLIYTNTTL